MRRIPNFDRSHVHEVVQEAAPCSRPRRGSSSPVQRPRSCAVRAPCRVIPRLFRAGFSESAPPSSRAIDHIRTTVHPTRSPRSHKTAAQPRDRVRNAQRAAPSLHSPHPFTAHACVRLPSWRGQLALVLVRRMGTLSMSTSSPNVVPSLHCLSHDGGTPGRAHAPVSRPATCRRLADVREAHLA